MKETLAAIQELKGNGVIADYAIGGAVGATFYVEPIATLDVDVFVLFSHDPDEALISLTPIYDYLKDRGCEAKDEYVVLGGWPVQFLPLANPLIEEAVAEAADTDVEGIPTRIMTAEHLAAIALQLGRAKDYARVIQLVEAGCLDRARLDAILERHGLASAWAQFQRRFLEGSG